MKSLKAILGIKLDTVQEFTQEGVRIPVTKVKAGPCYVVQVKTPERDGYWALQLGFGQKKLTKANQPLRGHLKRARLKFAPLFLKEIRLEEAEKVSFKPGEEIKVAEIFQPGDVVKVTGRAKGKGFTGVVKRWGFKGGPKTHGQSDRLRAPGSIGQQNVGRVFPGKKMPGRAGGQKVTLSGLTVMAVDSQNNLLLIKGLLPGAKNSPLVIKKIGEKKDFVPLLKEKEVKDAQD